MMNIKKQLKSVTFISILCAGFMLSSTSAMAERHYSDKHHNNKSSQKHSSHKRSHNDKYQKSHSKQRHQSHSKQRHQSHSKHSRGHSKHSHKSRHNHGYKSRHNHGHRHNYVRYIEPWYDDRYYWDNARFTFGYQNDHFGFTFRD